MQSLSNYYPMALQLYRFIIVCSAGLTGFYGWTIGVSYSYVMAIIVGGIFAALVLLLGILITALTVSARERNTATMIALAPFVIALQFGDIVSNIGSVAFTRKSELTAVDNQNTVARNARSEVSRIESRIADIRATTAWQGTFNAPAAYDELIASATKYIDLEDARGGCGPKCEARMRERDELVAAQANARKREALKKEMLTLETELKDAKARVQDTPTSASAALTHATAIAALLTGRMEPDQESTFWSKFGLDVLAGILISIGAMGSALIVGILRPEQTVPVFDPSLRQVSADTSRPNVTPKSSDALPLRSVTIQSNGRLFESDREIDRLLAKLNERIA